MIIWGLVWFAVQEKYGVSEWNPHYLAFLASVGPAIIAQVLTNLTENAKRSIMYPFHKDGWRAMSLHLAISSVVCLVPVYVLVHMLLAPPGEAFYYWIRK